MQQIFKDFHFTRRTKTGALALLVILILLLLVWRLLPAFAQPKNDKDEIALQAAWVTFQKEHIIEDAKNPSRGKSDQRTEKARPVIAKAELFTFDPNTASASDLHRLGLPSYTVNTILKYRAKSPQAFKVKEDLQKLYTLKREDYGRIAPYIRILPVAGAPAEQYKPAAVEHYKPVAESKNTGTIDLNSADAGLLMSLPGIGPAYSKRIINYRNVLGGFLKVEQLKEVYGLPDSTYRKLKDRLTVNAALVSKININAASQNDLGRHPYIGRKLAADIVKWRDNMGPFNDLEQIRQVPLINEEKYRKIAPYLSIH